MSLNCNKQINTSTYIHFLVCFCYSLPYFTVTFLHKMHTGTESCSFISGELDSCPGQYCGRIISNGDIGDCGVGIPIEFSFES